MSKSVTLAYFNCVLPKHPTAKDSDPPSVLVVHPSDESSTLMYFSVHSAMRVYERLDAVR
jgi:hypothetical protein